MRLGLKSWFLKVVRLAEEGTTNEFEPKILVFDLR